MTDIVTCGPVCSFCLERAVQSCRQCGVYTCPGHSSGDICTGCEDLAAELDGLEDTPVDLPPWREQVGR
ncbi:MAG: hypothetical protein OXN97_06575 [Bryobacterales bacterium]|nr:hypothetical protein [Bryobacterales bacterium]MDE0629514.1 hypothetical protein [Bryobacterales bacterium]